MTRDLSDFNVITDNSVTGAYCARCDTTRLPLLAFSLPPQHAAIQFCPACLTDIAAAASTYGLLAGPSNA